MAFPESSKVTGLHPTLLCSQTILSGACHHSYPGDPGRGSGQDRPELRVLVPPQERNTESLTHKASVLAREMDAQQEGESKAKAGR